MNSSVTLDPEQSAAFNALNNDQIQRVALYGKPGTGKSAVIKLYTKDRPRCQVAFTALCASMHRGGRTIHSVFGFDFEGRLQPLTQSALKHLQSLDSIIIDEISMVPAVYLMGVVQRMQEAKGNKKFNGGCKMIIAGDFQQVENLQSAQSLWKFIYKFETFVLTKIYRTQELRLQEFWNRVQAEKPRCVHNVTNYVTIPSEIIIYQSCESKVYGAFPLSSEDILNKKDTVILVFNKKECERINQKLLDQTQSPLESFKPLVLGKACDNLEPLNLKIGIPVMVNKNTRSGVFIPNGRRGIIESFGAEHIIIRTIDDAAMLKIKRVPVFLQSKRAPGETVRAQQFPLTVAFAIGTMKAQGQNIKSVALAYKPQFDDGVHGLFNSAVTRVSSISSLTIDMRAAEEKTHHKQCCKVQYKSTLLNYMKVNK
jgi:ATP-dependent exoDNAse (exonuclease V) alpha subunit